MSYPPLQCFNAHMYASIDDLDDDPYQCIAPTAKKLRCRWTVSYDDVEEASELRQQAGNHPHGAERDRLIRQFLLLHCCTNQHRHRLESNRNGCLSQLIRTFGASFEILPLPANRDDPWQSSPASSSQEPSTTTSRATSLSPVQTPKERTQSPPSSLVQSPQQKSTLASPSSPVPAPTIAMELSSPSPPLSNSSPEPVVVVPVANAADPKQVSNVEPVPQANPFTLPPQAPPLSTTPTTTIFKFEAPRNQISSTFSPPPMNGLDFSFQPQAISKKLGSSESNVDEQIKQLRKERDQFKDDAVRYKDAAEHYKKELERHQELLRKEWEKLDYFIPYVSDPADSIRKDLLSEVDIREAASGEVYSYVWPEHPEYSKIGYTAISAEERLEGWQVCNPRAILKTAVLVPFPKRIERLIHLQMARYRHKIRVCQAEDCNRSHEEWFKLPEDYVKQVIHEWRDVVRREKLYDANRHLTPRWYARLVNFEGEITAKALLKMLDEEALSQQSHELDSINKARRAVQPDLLTPPRSIHSPEAESSLERICRPTFASQARSTTTPDMQIPRRPLNPPHAAAFPDHGVRTGSPRPTRSRMSHRSSMLPEPVHPPLPDREIIQSVDVSSDAAPSNKLLDKVKNKLSRYNLRSRNSIAPQVPILTR